MSGVQGSISWSYVQEGRGAGGWGGGYLKYVYSVYAVWEDAK